MPEQGGPYRKRCGPLCSENESIYNSENESEYNRLTKVINMLKLVVDKRQQQVFGKKVFLEGIMVL